MPTYEYECTECQYQFEKKQRYCDESEVKCPKCQAKAKRLFSSVPVIFKGSGFYVNDYKKSSGKSGEGNTAPLPATSKPDTPKPDVSKPPAKKD